VEGDLVVGGKGRGLFLGSKELHGHTSLQHENIILGMVCISHDLGMMVGWGT
jgi:hypothetical protein